MKRIIISFITFITTGLFSIHDVQAQSNVNLFFEGEITSRGISVYDCQLLVIDQTGYHSFIPVKNKFKFSITPNRQFVIAALKPGFVPEIIILDANAQMLGNGSHSIEKKFSVSQYDPTSEKWMQMTKFGQIYFNANSGKFQSSSIELEEKTKEQIVQLLFDEKYNDLKEAVMQYSASKYASKYDSIFSNETKDLQTQVRGLQIKEVEAKNNAKSAKKGLVYSLQFGAFSKSLPSDHFLYSKIPNLTYSLGEDGIYRYKAGEFKSLDDALDFKDGLFEKGITESFVIATLAGKRVVIPSLSDTIRNPEVDKWNLKVRKTEAEINYFEISTQRLQKEEILIQKEMEELQESNIDVPKEDINSREKNLKQITLKMKKNTATLEVKKQKLEVAKQKHRNAMKNEILSDDGKIRSVMDTVFVDKDIVANYIRKSWFISAGTGTTNFTGDLSLNNASSISIPSPNYFASISRKINPTLSIKARIEQGKYLWSNTINNINTINITDYQNYALILKGSVSQLFSTTQKETYWDFGLNAGATVFNTNSSTDLSINALTGGIYYQQVLFPQLLMTLEYESSMFLNEFGNTLINSNNNLVNTPFELSHGWKISFSYNFDIILRKKENVKAPGRKELHL